MELSQLREHYESLTTEGYKLIGAEVIVRRLNNFLRLRPPRYKGWALPSVLLLNLNPHQGLKHCFHIHQAKNA